MRNMKRFFGKTNKPEQTNTHGIYQEPVEIFGIFTRNMKDGRILSGHAKRIASE